MKQSEQTYLEKPLERIDIETFSASSHAVFKTDENKDLQIKNWLISKINEFKFSGNDKYYLLPTKAEFAYKLNVSVGTVQSALRLLEYDGYVISKQRVGTIINTHSKATSVIQKSFTKKDMAYNAICKYLCAQKINTALPSTRVLAAQLGFSQNTIRLALDALVNEKVIIINKKYNSDFSWVLKQYPKNISDFSENLSLTEKISKEIISFLIKNSKIGEKLPSHNILSKKFSVSIKTINDVIKKLAKKGYVETRRGRYGTIVIKNSEKNPYDVYKPETSIFANASMAFEYNYQKVKNSIIDYIIKNYEVGTKLPTMQEFSEIFDVSTNTIRKALTELSNSGCIEFQRGRFGGTFLINLPESGSRNAFKWIAVSPEYKEVYTD